MDNNDLKLEVKYDENGVVNLSFKTPFKCPRCGLLKCNCDSFCNIEGEGKYKISIENNTMSLKIDRIEGGN